MSPASTTRPLPTANSVTTEGLEDQNQRKDAETNDEVFEAKRALRVMPCCICRS